MTTFADIKRVCDSVNGQHETGGADGKSGNVIFVWAELQPNYQGQPYCAGGVSWTWKHAGHPYPAIDHPWGFSYTPDAVNWAKSKGLWQAGGTYQPGDTVLFDWAKDGHADHVGIVIADHGTYLDTFEFNTTAPGAVGDQRNGGGCYYRQRTKDATVLGVLQSSKWLVPAGGTAPVKPAPKPVAKTVKPNPYKCPALTAVRPVLKQGARMSDQDIRFVQWAVACVVDGQWGPNTTNAVETFQKYHGVVKDGVVGSQTLGALRRVVR